MDAGEDTLTINSWLSVSCVTDGTIRTEGGVRWGRWPSSTSMSSLCKTTSLISAWAETNIIAATNVAIFVFVLILKCFLCAAKFCKKIIVGKKILSKVVKVWTKFDNF